MLSLSPHSTSTECFPELSVHASGVVHKVACTRELRVGVGKSTGRSSSTVGSWHGGQDVFKWILAGRFRVLDAFTPTGNHALGGNSRQKGHTLMNLRQIIAVLFIRRTPNVRSSERISSVRIIRGKLDLPIDLILGLSALLATFVGLARSVRLLRSIRIGVGHYLNVRCAPWRSGMLASVSAIVASVVLLTANFANGLRFHTSIGRSKTHERSIHELALERNIRIGHGSILLLYHGRLVNSDGNVGIRPWQCLVSITSTAEITTFVVPLTAITDGKTTFGERSVKWTRHSRKMKGNFVLHSLFLAHWCSSHVRWNSSHDRLRIGPHWIHHARHRELIADISRHHRHSHTHHRVHRWHPHSSEGWLGRSSAAAIRT
mmetsp:Transcript_21029/g.45538  ORF Transcript_21029/g.45538 Transcript_21029/m.45538 type:complete len:375 (+) Transcript_21029:388-1512(+)